VSRSPQTVLKRSFFFSVLSVVIPVFFFLALLVVSSGCGGGGSSQNASPPLPSPDFAVTFSANSLSLLQGATSPPLNVSVTPQNGFTATVQIALNGLPTGVISNPASPFSVTPAANTSVVFGAAPNAGTGSFTITAQAISGPLSHSSNFSLAVQSSLGYTAQVYPNSAFKGEPSPYKFLLYDKKRQFLYLSAASQIDVFDLYAAAFKPAGLTLYCPSYRSPGPCPDDDVRGMALTPDGSQLIAADFGSQNIYLLDPDTPNTPAVATSVAASGYGPTRVATTSVQTVFVALSAEATPSGICTSCLSQLDLTTTPPTVQPAPQPAVANLTGAPLSQADATGGRVFLSFVTPPGGPLGIWDASLNNFEMSKTNEAASDLAVAADGTMFATVTGGSIEIRSVDPSLQSTLVSSFAVPNSEQVPGRLPAPGIAMHPTGALVYQPFLTGPPPAAPSSGGPQGGVDILDAHTGQLRLRVFLPEPLAMLSTDIDALHGSFLAINETGQKIFALTNSGLTVVQLANVPLGIGTISPATAPAAGGTTLTIRGTGFQSGTSVTIGGKTASVVFKDMNTLTVVTPSVTAGPQQIVITNPDGEKVTLDAAFAAS
jgi:hypothetical protein